MHDEEACTASLPGLRCVTIVPPSEYIISGEAQEHAVTLFAPDCHF